MGDFTVQISNDLVDRLIDNDEKLKRKTRKIKPRLPKEPQHPQSKVNPKQPSNDSVGLPIRPPFFLPVTPPAHSANSELDAIRSVLKESESVVERLQKQEENVLHEVTERAKELRDKEFKLPYQKPMPCSAENNACLECYREHAKDPLKCAYLVRSFADCARRARQQVSTASKQT